MQLKAITRLKNNYASVDDIDLYMAGLVELPTDGGLVGPTVSCLIAEHFATLKKSDRYFFELSSQRSSFSSGDKKSTTFH